MSVIRVGIQTSDLIDPSTKIQLDSPWLLLPGTWLSSFFSRVSPPCWTRCRLIGATLTKYVVNKHVRIKKENGRYPHKIIFGYSSFSGNASYGAFRRIFTVAFYRLF